MLPEPYYHDDDAGITIYHADCRDILPLLPKVDLVLTDPPYGINYDEIQNKNHESGRISNGGRWKKYEYYAWDKIIPTPEHFKLVLNAGKIIIIWGGNYFFLPSKCRWLVWNKIQRNFMSDGEMAWTNLQGQVEIFDMSRTDAYINNHDGKFHPTQKPVQLMKWCVEQAGEVQTILDPFMGSGTTLVAAKQLHRKAIGIEIEEKYCEIAVKRLGQGVLPL